jgi:hypothetical protein
MKKFKMSLTMGGTIEVGRSVINEEFYVVVGRDDNGVQIIIEKEEVDMIIMMLAKSSRCKMMEETSMKQAWDMIMEGGSITEVGSDDM